MTNNPFTFGNPIRDPAHFIGRLADLQQIINRLQSSAHESTSIVGERRIGKTSLLKYLADKHAAEELGLPPEEFCLIYMDFQGLLDITPQRFWQRVLQKISRAICLQELRDLAAEVRGLETLDLFDLVGLFTKIADAGLTVVLLLDEFEYVTQNTNFTSNFFGGLRALAIHHNLPLVTATRRELVDLCHSDEIKGSPFFNIFANLVLRPFEPQEVIELITNYLEGTGVQFSNSDIDLVLSLSGGYPFFTQMAAHYLYNAKLEGLSGDALVVQVTQSFDKQAESHYQTMWSRANESEKITMLSAMALNNLEVSSTTDPTLKNLANLHSRANLDVPELVKRGLLIEDKTASTYRPLSHSLERWINKEIQNVLGKKVPDSAIMEWLEGEGSDIPGDLKSPLAQFKEKYWSMLSDLPQEMSQRLVSEREKPSKKKQATHLQESTFICYSRNDKTFADRLVGDLNAQGVQTWRDVDNIAGSRQSNLRGWRAAIENSLDNCGAMLILLSPGAVNSPEVEAEWNHFASKKRPIFPIIAQTCKIPFYLKIYQIWNLSEDYTKQVDQLGEMLNKTLTTQD
ncbi:MAG: TIR domain-containing protein [Chloroflexota bacterium]|nr:TIR domain-containing protein [Chloroflexota bacterium]